MEHEDIINNLLEALSFSPNNIPLRLQLASTYLQAQQLEKAEQQYREVLQLDANNQKAKYGLAKLAFQQQKYSTCVVILEALLEENPEAQNTLLLYAKALLREGSLDKAIEAYQRIIVLDPSFKDEELDQHLRQAQHATEATFDDANDEELNELLEKPVLNFKHVGGMKRVKEEIELKIIHPLQHKELYEAYGKKIGGGILLYGPPGCGKTHLAKATAGEVNAKFISIGIHDVLDMWIGNSEKNLHEIFELARRNAPCVLFFDEVDALGASRSDLRQSAGRHLINQFLSELDGVDSNNDGLLVIGATNAPWHLDPAFRRPGRFDRIIFVEPPDQAGRSEILKITLEGKPLGKVDYDAVAKKIDGFSGADITAVVDLCIEDKLRASMKSGVPSPIQTKDLIRAAKRHKASTKEWFNSARNYALYANDSGLYDEILKYLKISKP